MSRTRIAAIIACAAVAICALCVGIMHSCENRAQLDAYVQAQRQTPPDGYAYINDQSYVVYEIATGWEYFFEDGVLEPRCCISGEQYNYYDKN